MLRTAHTTINHTPHGPINSGRPPRRSIVELSHSAHSYLLLLGVTIFIFSPLKIYDRAHMHTQNNFCMIFFQSPPEFTTEPLFSRPRRCCKRSCRKKLLSMMSGVGKSLLVGHRTRNVECGYTGKRCLGCLLVVLIAPECAHTLGNLCLLGILLVGRVEARTAEALGEELLLYEVASVAMGILIVCAVA